MSSPFDKRLARLIRHARLGWDFVQRHPSAREESRQWLLAHPSHLPDVDALWLECLDGQGPLAEWLSSTRKPEEWEHVIPLHSILASHPFPSLQAWLSLEMFRRS